MRSRKQRDAPPSGLIAAVAGALLLLLTSCTSDDAALDDGRRETTSPQAPKATTTSTPVPTPPPARYAPVPGEPAVEAKQLASDLVQALATFPAGGGTASATLARTESLGGTSEIVAAAAPLLDPEAAGRGEIVYPQLGGLTSTDASVMVIVHQQLDGPGGAREISRTVDVRLTRAATGWKVAAIASLGDGSAPPEAAASAQAMAVLGNPNVTMPDTARWDIRLGRVDARVLEVIATLAVDHTVGITTLVSGHPVEVFGTGRPSNHSAGRAVDIWSVDGQPVVSERSDGGPLRLLVQQLFDRGVEELGSPWDLDGARSSRSFTNEVHQDHLHLGFHRG